MKTWKEYQTALLAHLDKARKALAESKSFTDWQNKAVITVRPMAPAREHLDALE